MSETNVNIANDLSSRIVDFISSARNRGFNIGVEETLAAHQVAHKTNMTNKRQLQQGLKTLLCNNSRDWERFDDLFHQYWQSSSLKQETFDSIGGKGRRAKTNPANENSESDSCAKNKRNSKNKSHFDVPDASDMQNQNAAKSDLSDTGASSAQNIEKKSFEHLADPIELRRTEDLAEQLAQRIRKRLTKRWRSHKSGKYIDMRSTIHKSLRKQGLPLNLSFRQRERKQVKIVLLLDVSRSMNIYSYLFLRFTRGILGAFKQADAFAFHTHLVHISDALRDPSPSRLSDKMSLISASWGGGTRIGESLKSFNQNYGQILNNRSIVIVVSDGFDTGEPKELVKQLRQIKSRAHRLVWLNPLLGRSDYSPEGKCMKASLPLLDVFAPAHNLQSLAELETYLT